MAQDISLWGATYSDVPSVTLPKSGGGTAEFTDTSDTTATASAVVSGYQFYDSGGTRTVGTYVDQDTKYSLNAVMSTITLTGSDGSTSSLSNIPCFMPIDDTAEVGTTDRDLYDLIMDNGWSDVFIF